MAVQNTPANAAPAEINEEAITNPKAAHYHACREQKLFPIVAADYVRSKARIQCERLLEQPTINQSQLLDLANVVIRSEPGSGASVAGDKSSAFFSVLSRRVAALNQIDAYEAALFEACARAEKNPRDTSWFEKRVSEPRDYSSYRGVCERKLADVRKAVSDNYDDFRMGLALGYPTGTPANYDGVLQSEVTSAIRDAVVPRVLSQPYGDLPQPPALTDAEQKAAFEKLSQAAHEAHASLSAPASPAILRGRFTDYQNAADVAMAVDLKFRRGYQAKYQGAIARAPILGFLSSAHPSIDELIAAAGAVSANAEAVAQKSLKPNDLARYPGIIESVLQERPEWCGVAQGWAEDRETQAKVAEKLDFAVGAAIGAQCVLTGWTVVGGILCATEGAAWSAHAIANSSKIASQERALAFSSVLSSEKVADLTRLTEAERTLKIELFFAPLTGLTVGKLAQKIAGGTAKETMKDSARAAVRDVPSPVAKQREKPEFKRREGASPAKQAMPQPATGYELKAKTGRIAKELDEVRGLTNGWEEGALEHIFIGRFRGDKLCSGLHCGEALEEFSRASGTVAKEFRTDANGVRIATWSADTKAFNAEGKAEAIRTGKMTYGFDKTPTKTLFPSSWNRERTVRAIQQAFDSCRERIPVQSCVEVVDGVPIKAVIDRDTHRLISAFPVFQP